MKEMIYKEDALNIIRSFISSMRPDATGLITDIYDAVLHMPSAQPKTGKWMTDNPSDPYESDYCKCSVCGYINCTVEVLAFDGYKYCPNCGADMRGDTE